MVDVIDKKEELRRAFPKPFYNLKPGQGLSIVLEIIGDLDNDMFQNVKNAREQLLLSKAVQDFLNVHGINLDVYKPLGATMRDNAYRELIKVITNSPKNAEHIFERIITIFFGSMALQTGLVDVFSVRNHEIIFRINRNALIVAITRQLLGTTYLHRNFGAYDGDSLDLWTANLVGTINAGDESATLSSVVGVPLDGIIELNTSTSVNYEVKSFTRVGNVITFASPVSFGHVNNEPVQGPQFPDDYPSGYLYDQSKETDLVGALSIGATSLTIGSVPENMPTAGVLYIGDPELANFEGKGFTRSGTSITLQGGTVFAHSSGEKISIPVFNRKINTTLSAPIAQGSTGSSTIAVVNGADFPVRRGAIKIALSFENEEIVPFVGRVVGDNSVLQIDPGYVFKFDHSSGEKVQLMSNKTRVSIDGTDYPFYLNDTAKLRDQFIAILRRIKVVGVKLNVQLV